MAVYAMWNNKGGVGKSYLTFQVASEYARTHPEEKVLVVDMCPQANSSSMLLGGIIDGEKRLDRFATGTPRQTISGYIEERIRSPYTSPRVGSSYPIRVASHNNHVPGNLHLVVGDAELEIQSWRILNATQPGPADAWRSVHSWIAELIDDIRSAWNQANLTVFIDCNPSFTVYTELALSASDHLIIPFSADGSSKRAVRSVLNLVYGSARSQGAAQSQFVLNSNQWRMKVPTIYCYVGNRLTQMHMTAATAFDSVVNDIGKEIWDVWNLNKNNFAIHPAGAPAPRNRVDFRKMFQYEINDANSASVVSGGLGIPISVLGVGYKNLAGKRVMVNQTQLNKQKPNIRDFVKTIK